MEEPRYAEINAEELAEIEAELGHSATRELAQWFIRNRMNRDAVERMLATDTARLDIDANLQNVRDIKEAESRKAVSVLKKAKKKCA